MATNTVVDQYYLELERPSEHDNSPKPIRAMAMNTADSTKTAETWWSRESAKANLLAVMGAAPELVDWYLQQLEDHRYVQLETSVPGTKAGRPIFNSRELVRMSFAPDDLEL
jgi:hypothetical protein